MHIETTSHSHLNGSFNGPWRSFSVELWAEYVKIVSLRWCIGTLSHEFGINYSLALHLYICMPCLSIPFLPHNIHNLLCVVPNFYTNIMLYAVQQHQSHNHHGCQICPSQWIIADEYICVTCVSELH